MSKDNLNHPGIKVNLVHNIMEKKMYGSVKVGLIFFLRYFYFKRNDEITFFQYTVLPNYFTQK